MTKEKYYPFVMLGCATAVCFIYLGMVCNVMGLYTPAILEEYPNFSRSSFTLAVTLMNLLAALGNMLHTPVRERVNIRGMLVLGWGLTVTGMSCYASAHRLPVFYAAGALIGLGFGFCGSGTASLMVNAWFAKRRGTFVSVAMAGAGLGVAAASPVISRGIEQFGWRATFWLITGCVAVLGLILILIYRSTPETAGLPGRWGEEPGQKREETLKEKKKVRVREHPAYMTVLILIFLMGIVLYSVMANLSVIATDMGYSIIQIGTMSSLMFAVNVVMQLPVGMGCDRFGTSRILWIIVGLISAVHLLFLVGGRLPFVCMLAASVVFGCGKTGLNNLAVDLVQEVVEEEDKPPMLSLGVAFLSLGSASGIYLVQMMYDLTGSYRLSYLILIAAAAVCVAIDLYLCRKRKGIQA